MPQPITPSATAKKERQGGSLKSAATSEPVHAPVPGIGKSTKVISPIKVPAERIFVLFFSFCSSAADASLTLSAITAASVDEPSLPFAILSPSAAVASAAPSSEASRITFFECFSALRQSQLTMGRKGLKRLRNSSIFGMKSSEGKDVVLAVPINLRNKFQSQSLRNFIHLAKISLRKKETENSMESMVKEIRRQLHLQNNKEYLHKAISQYGRLQKSYTYILLFLKQPLK